MRMLHGDERLPNGIIHHSDRHPEDIKRVAVTCLRCNTKRYVLIPRGKQRKKEGWTGACHSCAMGVRKETWRHPNGALILWGKRARGQKHLVPFICLKCGEEKIVRASQVYQTAKPWSGWCGDCIAARNPKKITEDYELKPYGSAVLFSQRTSTHIPVRCGMCGRTRLMSEGSVLCNY
jgi:transcription elongation factor Elf1